jgi:acetylornithine deacetylase/succinyl-diaminopimelate desuccinylase-like protein
MSMPQNVIELCRALVRIPSVNPDGNPGTEQVGEKVCAEFVGGFLKKCGARVEYQEVLPERPNVIGRFPTDRIGKPCIIFAPHTDTVSVVGMTIDPFGGELRDGKISGRGATDTKGPMASMLWTLWELREVIPGLPYEIWFTGLMSEEAGQNGSKAFARSYDPAEAPATFALIGEPTGCDIVYAHKGCIWLNLRTQGVAVHASTPELGENAIYKMADAIRILREEFLPQFAALKDPVLGAPTLSVGTVSGGSKTNIVPDFCEAAVDLRTIPSQNTQNLINEIQARLTGVEISVQQSLPLYTDPAHPLIATLEKAGGKTVGAPWFCDAAVFSAAGIAAVAAGPGSIAQAHTKDEWIGIDDLQRGVEFYRSFLLSLPK